LRDEHAVGEPEGATVLSAAGSDLQNGENVPSRGEDRRAPSQNLDSDVG
jgi:hypothetical protein